MHSYFLLIYLFLNCHSKFKLSPLLFEAQKHKTTLNGLFTFVARKIAVVPFLVSWKGVEPIWTRTEEDPKDPVNKHVSPPRLDLVYYYGGGSALMIRGNGLGS